MSTKEVIINILKSHSETLKSGSDGEYYPEIAVHEDSFEDVAKEIMKAF